MDLNAVAFWTWFAATHQEIARAYDDSDFSWLRRELTTRIRAIQPRLNWELGPYHLPDQTLVISPSIRENVELACRVVADAPPIPGWHFLPAKPPKELTQLKMELPEVPGVEVCADQWVYRLTGYNDLEFFDIEVFTDLGPEVSDSDLQQLAHRLIEALVGEALYLEKFAQVAVFRANDPRPVDSLTRLPMLGRHVEHLLQ